MLAAAARIETIPVLTQLVPILAMIYSFVYLVAALRRAYRQSVAGALGRAVVVTAIYFVLIVGAFLSIIAPVIFTL